jgi:very-short-patch-repair endonuclease
VHQRARKLRREQTEAEARLWAQLRAHRLFGAKFHRQFPIGDFIADFCCCEKRSVIELDGGQHVDQAAADSKRSSLLEERGFTVLRFWNIQVFENLEGVLEEIARAIGQPSP